MKHLTNAKRLLSLLLALSLLLSFAVPFAGAEEAAAENTQPETYELDPATLHVQKLGQVGAEAEEDAEITLPYQLGDIVRVSIVLNEPATAEVYETEGIASNQAAVAYRQQLRRQQDAVQAEIEQVTGRALDVQWNLTLLANIISANVRYGDIVKIGALRAVKKVFIENRYEAPVGDDGTEVAVPNTANTAENMVGAFDAWESGYTGAGSRIAIIDTGVDTQHQSFAEEPFTYAVNAVGASSELLTKAQVQALAGQLNSKSGNYVSAKIPYGYNYVDNNTTIDHLSDTAGNHGSHVAGIAAANRYIGSDHADAAQSVGAVGMAPNAQLLVMKVFGSNGGAYDSDYMVAIEDAIILDCDAANLSLGSAAPGWTYDTEYQDILNNLVNKSHNEGMVVSISAGNSYEFAMATDSKNIYKDDIHFHTGGSPGSYVNSLCVAAAQNTLTKGMPLIFNGSQKVFYSESTKDDEGNTYTNPEMNSIAGSYNYVYIDAIGNPEDFSAVNSAVSLSGKIVLVNRGELSFSEKGNNAKSYNPKGMVIANNADGTINMNLADFTGTFPMVSISLKDANQIKAGGTAHTAGNITYYTGSVQVTNTEESVRIDREQATITEFSSWGIPGSMLMKPEITAPGGDIYSVYGQSKADSGSSHTTYESFSGTSMAAPHIAGLTGVLAEYLRENPIADRNSELAQDYSTRAILQSLLMSTATPMAPDGEYLSILQQGAGLAEVHQAAAAPSVVMITDEGNTLTVRTGANLDGKVKAELGDDPEKTGSYSFGFKVYNLSDEVLTYELDTDLFTQKIQGEFLAHGTSLLPEGGVSYTWNGESTEPESHDVDKDGDTDNDDVQAILDYLSGEKAEADVDLAAADLDADGKVSSRDAYLLIDWQAEEPENTGYTVPAHGSAVCVVTVQLTAEQRQMLDQYAKGAYLEGFTRLRCTVEGKTCEHSIPILGFYGSWTEPSMFDNMSYADELYGAERYPYSGYSDTNYLMLNYNGANVKFSGNPYLVEETFPSDRLAINSSTSLQRIAYNLIRSAGTTGFAVTKLDDDHKNTAILSSLVTGNNIVGQYYHVNQATWMNTMTKFYSIGKTVSSYGLGEGDRFRVGFYAIPEYYGMLVKESYNESSSGALNQTGFDKLLTDNMLGSGAFVGYDFVVDNTAPSVTDARLNGNELSISASDDRALAYVAVLSLDGSVKYAEAAPGTESYTVSFDASDAIANAQGYVAAFAGDYAGNEAAIAVKVNNNTHVEKTVYVQTSTLTAGDEYLILNTANPGAGYSLYYTLNTSGTTATTRANAVTVQTGTADTGNKPYVESTDAAATAVWTAGSGTGSYYTFNNNGWYLRVSNQNNLTITKDTSRRDWTWNGTNNRLSYSNTTRYLRYYNNTFSVSTTTNSVYLYVKTTISYEVDPYSVSGITLTPNSLDLYRGGTADLTAKVIPLTASDRTVTWSSSNSAIATVDQSGHVTGVNGGTAIITATSHADNTIFASCTVNVTAINKELSAAIWDEEGSVYFSYFNANDLPNWTKRSNNPTGVYVTSAFMPSTSSLYACTNDLSSSVIYTVNRTSYAMTELGENYVMAFGMAPVSAYFGTSYYVYAFASYLIFGNLEPETDEELGTYSGFPYGLLDLTETDVGDAYAVAVCIRNRPTSTYSAGTTGYYFLDETGKIWQTNLTYSSSAGIVFSAPTLVYDTGISAGLQYNSIYYDGTNLFWTRQDGNIAELVILANADNAANRKLYRAGDFGEGVWPAAGLYVNGSVAPASVGDETMGVGDEPLMLENLKPLRISREALMTPEILARFAAEAQKNGRNEPVNPVTGGLNRVRGNARVLDTNNSTAEAEDGTVTVSLTETEDVNNGLITVTYDPDVLTYTGCTSDFTYKSVHAESGVVTLALADTTARKALGVLTFSYTEEPETTITIHTAERNENLAVEEEDTVLSLAPDRIVSVYIVDELDGNALYAWAWGNAGNLDNAWPGHALNAEGTEKGGHSYYKQELNLTDHDKLILNRNGQPQTGTLDVAADAGDKDYVVYYIYGVSGNDLKASAGTDLWPAPGVVTAPTCTDGGYTTYTGMFTGEIKIENETPALGHTPAEAVEENRVEPTVNSEGGYDSVVYCSVCGAELSREHVTLSILLPEITGHSLNAAGVIQVNIYANVPESLVESGKIFYSFGGADAKQPVTSSMETANGYRFTIACPAKNMHDAQTLSFFDADGNPVNLLEGGVQKPSHSYSVQEYLDYVIENAPFETLTEDQNNKLIVLCKAMSDYGHYAQVEKDYETDNLSTLHLASEIAEVSADDSFAHTDGTNIRYYGISLLMRSETVIRVYFKVTGDAGNYRAYIDGSTEGIALTASSAANYYYVELEGINAKDFGTAHDFVVDNRHTQNGTATDSASVTGYSVHCYVATVLRSDSTSKSLKDVVRAIYLYGVKAEAYFNARQAS